MVDGARIASFFGRAKFRWRVATGVFVAICLTAYLSPAVHADQWYESYKKAGDAIDQEDWSTAIDELNQALLKKGDSSAQARTYGMNFTSYFPYLKLGIAYYSLGQFDAALQALETEEKLGAIVQSDVEFSKLNNYRDLIREARSAEEQQRIQQAVFDGIAAAGQLETQGELQEALVAADRALSVDPDNAEALGIKTRLLDRVATQEAQAENDKAFAQLVEDGKSQLSAEDFQTAASTFNRALSLNDGDPEATSLLEQAQAGLRARLEAQQGEERRQTTISAGLRQATDLEQAEDFLGALDALQSVLALDPANSRAAEMQQRLRRAQTTAEGRAATLGTVARLLAEARDQYDAGDFESSLRRANRALALDRTNSEALSHIQRAYQAMSQEIVGGTAPPLNFAPALQFTPDPDRRLVEVAEGVKIEVVSNPAYFLQGIVIDASPVTIAFSATVSEIFSPTEWAESIEENGQIAPTREVTLEGAVSQTSMGGIEAAMFSLPVVLTPGLWTLQVIPTDVEGLSPPSEYLVIYQRPWYRSPWLHAGIFTAIAALIASAFTRRVIIRGKRLKRRFNPYIAGAPILDEQNFYGRERLLHHVLQRIHNNSILLYGERRIGKTSLQHQLKQRLIELKDPEYEFYPAYIDLQGTPEHAFFATMAEDIFQELAHHLNGVGPDSALEAGTYDYRAFVLDVRKILKALRERSEKKIKLVLLIDEVDELNSYDPRINQKLRSLFMKSLADSLVSVVSGVEIKKKWELEGSPWYNFFQEIEVKAFRREDALELIEEPIKGIFKLDNGVADNIIERANCKPFDIQRICVALVDRLHDEGRRRITLADVGTVSGTMEI